jgi:general stress protein 26
MTVTTDAQGDREKVWDLIKDIRVALLVTTGADGRMAARPMAAMNRDFDGTLWFASRDNTPKLGEIAENTQVLLAYSDPKTQNYVSVAGNARLVRDSAKVRELWSEGTRVWFPKGPDDPEIVLIQVEVESAEFWDAPASAWVYALGYAKARLTGKPPRNVGDNKVVNF